MQFPAPWRRDLREQTDHLWGDGRTRRPKEEIEEDLASIEAFAAGRCTASIVPERPAS